MSSFSIETSKDNYKILKVNKNGKDIYIGSKYSQQREIDKFIKSFKELTENDIYIVVGVSLLEHIEELIKVNSSFKKILILEVNREVRNLLENNKIFNDKVKIATELDEVKKMIRENINDMNVDHVKIGYYSNYDKVYSEEVQIIMNFIKEESYSILANRNTNIHFSETWFKSLLENLKYMKISTPVNDLKDKFKDMPAVIVSAGPSLSKNIAELKNQTKGLVLSGGRTLDTLIDNKIKIDYLGVVDPTDYAYQLVEKKIRNIDIPLVYYNGTNQRVVEEHTGKKVFYTDNEFIRDIFDENISDIGGGGSIAHSLTNFAVYMGCNPIVFVGQDLAYTGEQLHDKNALTSDVDPNIAWNNTTDLYIDDVYGEKVRTSVILNDFRLHLENIIESNPSVKFINATEGGANIKGTQVQNLSEVLKNFAEIEIASYDERFIKSEVFDEKLKEYIKMLSEVNKRTKVGMSLIEELSFNIKRNNNSKINHCITKLEVVDSCISENIKKLTLLQNKIFAAMYKINNSLEFIVNSSDNSNVKMLKNLAKNKAIYEVMNQHSKEAKENLEEVLKE